MNLFNKLWADSKHIHRVRLINRTGAPSVKGTLVSASNTHDMAVKLQANEYDTIGVIDQDGVPDGSPVWIRISGIAEVLLKDGTASTRGNWVLASDADGRADATQPAPPNGSTLAELQQHFKEVGHCLESKAAGTNVKCKIVLHFN